MKNLLRSLTFGSAVAAMFAVSFGLAAVATPDGWAAWRVFLGTFAVGEVIAICAAWLLEDA